MTPNTKTLSSVYYKARLIVLAVSFSGCTLNNMALVRLPGDQERSLSEIASTRNDGSQRVSIKEINALVITPGGLNPPGKNLMVTIFVDVTLTGPKALLGIGTADTEHRAESECLQVIDNFRKTGLPAEFSKLCVSADLPDIYTTAIDGTTFCAYTIQREDLMNGGSPRQTFKNFRHIQ